MLWEMQCGNGIVPASKISFKDWRTADLTVLMYPVAACDACQIGSLLPVGTEENRAVSVALRCWDVTSLCFSLRARYGPGLTCEGIAEKRRKLISARGVDKNAASRAINGSCKQDP